MTSEDVFKLLFGGGNVTLPYLIEFSHPSLDSILLVNNTEDIVFDGKTYKASSFEYEEPDNQGDGGTLNISGIDNDLIEFVDEADYKYKLSVIGVLCADNEIKKLKGINHFYGSVSYDQTQQMNFNLGKDDRLDMVFTCYMYDTDSNAGNA